MKSQISELETQFNLDKYLRNYTFVEKLDLFSDVNDVKTKIEDVNVNGIDYPKYINEYWTSKQRKANSLHEIAYRACFKPQLPRFFVNLFTEPGDTVYDPFSGRGTTVVEAALLGRNIISNDINPLSEILTSPRLRIPQVSELKIRLDRIPINRNADNDIDLSMFYHKDTEAEIVSLKRYFHKLRASSGEDSLDKWIRMVATNRLTGHSAGFFSVYTLPPNQAVSQESQIKINKKREQIPEYRNTKELILRKSLSLLRNIGPRETANLESICDNEVFMVAEAGNTSAIKGDSVQLTVTSPPFLDTVQYAQDNWLRCWFNDIDVEEVGANITMSRRLEDWCDVMGSVFRELYRITKPYGWVAFEVGEIRSGSINLDEHVVALGTDAGFDCKGVVINEQRFTKTSNIWGIKNKEKGTNTNRIVIFRKMDR